MKKSTLFLTFALLLSAAAPDDKKARETFAHVVAAVNGIKDCQVRYRDDDTSGPNQQLRAHFIYEGKYLNHPRIYYQRLTECNFNYPEQTTPGFQEIYREEGDMIYILPPAYRALGVLSIYPEDPKSFGMRGENTKSSGPWDFINVLADMAKNGRISMEEAKLGSRDCLRFEITQNPGGWYRAGVNRARLFVDPKTLMPVRIERYEPGVTPPVVVTEYETFAANTGLTADQIKFEGLKNPFSLLKNPGGADIEPLIKTAPRKRLPDSAPDAASIIKNFNAAADKIDDYRADLTMGFRYGRLRLYREDRFAWHRNPYWFTLFTTVQKANYLLLSHSAGSALWYAPADHNIHLKGGGVQKIMGEQVFSGVDYKFFDLTGDNPYQIDFPALKKLVAESFTNDKAHSWTVEYNGKKMWEVQLARTGPTPTLAFGIIRIVFDPENNLPAVLDLTGYDDPQALIAMTFANIKTNRGLKPEETKF